MKNNKPPMHTFYILCVILAITLVATVVWTLTYNLMDKGSYQQPKADSTAHKDTVYIQDTLK